MIKIVRNFTPIKLTPEFVSLKTEEFETTGNNVWNIDWLKESLKELSFKKCAYCECDISEESKYMEVEHFEDKNRYKRKVLVWDNLLPSCKRCNGNKSTHDVIVEPIVNPFIHIPNDFIYLNCYRLQSKNLIGRTTIDLLDLNNYDRLGLPRFKIGDGLKATINIALEKLEKFETKPSALNTTKLLSTIEGILFECQKDKEYSATCATVLHTDEDYIQLRQRMIDLRLWNDTLEKLHTNSLELILVN